MKILLSLALFFCLCSSSNAAPPINLTKGFGILLRFNEPVASVFIGSNEIAEVQAVNEKAIYVSGLTAGTTNLLVMNYDNDIIRSHAIVVHPVNNETSYLLENLIPNGDVTVQSSGNTSIIRGNVDNIDDADDIREVKTRLEEQGRKVIDKTTTSTPVQVSLKVRIVELYRADLIKLGFDVSSVSSGSVFKVVTGSGIAQDFMSTLIGSVEGQTRVGISGANNSFNVNAMLDLLEKRGYIQILAEPRLTTVTGEKATFRSGGEFAVSVNQGNGVFTAEYKETGISIDFIPEILPGDKISIDISSEIKFVDPQSVVNSAPALLVRSVQTNAQVASGQTFALAGLYQLTQSSSKSGPPYLSKIPVFGNLLSKTNESREERELIFFITPYLVHSSVPIEKKQPTDLLATLGFIVE
ncbi:putative type III secretion component [Roseibium sp. TrichSKD4]|uniref:type II and III secretion system protein family protein n=1 Tax=Roseibium sp. TrichSKD4 TaxID=744980 RepID=UPI0001E56B16|nr:pilus assembly protein N-terminal domain-containing protein [Roseibium sp. TrichSKD4]EFO31937.1 putative type III secretion component [Roseibium sp. TrichSKD4]